MAAGIGALGMWLTYTDMIKKNETLKKYWYLVPLVLLVAGFLLMRREGTRAYGAIVMTLSGALFVKGYEERPDQDKKDQKETKGPDDEEAGAPHNLKAFRTANGQWWYLHPVTQQYLPMPTTPQNDAPGQQAARVFRNAG
jgi:hypothetical protein